MTISLNGTTGIQFPDSSLQAAAASPYTLKNKIINGDMRIDQRNAGASVTPTALQYTLDRWFFYVTQASKITTQQNQGSVTPPAGFSNYLGITSSSAYTPTGGDNFYVSQNIEANNISDLAWGTANAKTVTISFWVRSSLTGNFGLVVENAPTYNYSYPILYTINAANTWEYKTITIPAPTAGTWATSGNGIGFTLVFSLGIGTTYAGPSGAWAAANYNGVTGQTNVVATNGATFYITGVQLEQNTTATPFERRLYNQELDNCQRYYWQLNGEATYAGIGSGTMNTATGPRIFIPYPMPMRATPTISVTNIANTIVSQGADLNPSAITPYANSTGAMADLLTGTGTQGRGAVWLFSALASASVQATAEL
jgi:hypothetical protein